ncbi:MAG: helix-turn-helix transcriptional regulator [Eubacteriales bacterium]|nr:helix-turn-helix transcriptional regulator [Eubacteriales bacterium]
MSESEYAKLIARNLRRIMLEHDKTQAEVSKDLGISKATLSSWMNGTRIPRMSAIDRLCHYFNCTRVDIMEEQEEQDHYYIDEDARDLANFLHQSPRYRVLFDASRKVKEEDINFVKEMIDRMSGYDGDEPC